MRFPVIKETAYKIGRVDWRLFDTASFSNKMVGGVLLHSKP